MSNMFTKIGLELKTSLESLTQVLMAVLVWFNITRKRFQTVNSMDFSRLILIRGMQVIVANSKKKVTHVRESYILNKASVVVSLTFYVKEILLKYLFFSHVM